MLHYFVFSVKMQYFGIEDLVSYSTFICYACKGPRRVTWHWRGELNAVAEIWVAARKDDLRDSKFLEWAPETMLVWIHPFLNSCRLLVVCDSSVLFSFLLLFRWQYIPHEQFWFFGLWLQLTHGQTEGWGHCGTLGWRVSENFFNNTNGKCNSLDLADSLIGNADSPIGAVDSPCRLWLLILTLLTPTTWWLMPLGSEVPARYLTNVHDLSWYDSTISSESRSGLKIQIELVPSMTLLIGLLLWLTDNSNYCFELYGWLRLGSSPLDLGTCEASRFDSNSNRPPDSIRFESDGPIRKFSNRIERYGTGVLVEPASAHLTQNVFLAVGYSW